SRTSSILAELLLVTLRNKRHQHARQISIIAATFQPVCRHSTKYNLQLKRFAIVSTLPLRCTTMSRRTPKYSTHNNNADNIERYLQEDGHRTWGFVIYRCTYESDDDWDRFMGLRDQIRCTLEIYNGLDMMDSLSVTVF